MEDRKDKLKKLRTLEYVCKGLVMAGAGGFLTGALVNNWKISLISGGTGILSALGALYASKRQTYLENQDIKEYNSQYNKQTDNNYNKE